MSSRLLLAFILICAPMIKSTAQSKVRFGIKAGLNFPHFNASVVAPPLNSMDDDNYFYVGGEMQIRLNKHFSLQPEVFYVGHPVLENVTASERVQQLSIPVLAKLHVGRIAFYAGPQVDVLLKAVSHYYDGASGSQKDLSVTDSYKTGLSGVAGIEWTFRYRFGIDLRYVFGLTNIAKENGRSLLTSLDNQNIKINALQAGLFFRFGKKPNVKG